MTNVRDIEWPYEYSDLKRIEDFMICGICYEYMETSVMTPCSHNYCSLCIRKYLHYKTQCPVCFHVLYEKDLYINRAMDEIIQHYLQLRIKLLHLIDNKNTDNIAVSEIDPNTPPMRPARNNQFCKSPKVSETTIQGLINSTVSSSVATAPQCSTSNPSINDSPKVEQNIAKIFNTPKKREVLSTSIVSTKTVSCPVCSVEISETHINTHLDACLKRESSESRIKNKRIITKRPLLPKLVLRVMKDAELRKKMKEFGLSSQGDRKTLENRFTRYSIIYNTECDKLVPRAVADLIKQCELEEKQERKMDSFLLSASTLNRLQIEKNANEEKIEEAQKSYRHANKSSFEKLIEDVKSRIEIMKEKPTIETSNCNSKPSTSMNDNNLSECTREYEESIFKPSSDDAFQDIDSDESYPLQQYRSDDPLKYNSINLNNSTSMSSPESPIKTSEKSSWSKETVKSPMVHEKIFNKSDAVQADDESTDDDIETSPVLNKNLNRKKFKLSRKLQTFKSAEMPQRVSNNLTDTENHRIVARNLCNDIINDYSVDKRNDNRSSKFVEKLHTNERRGTGERLMDSVRLSEIKVEEKDVFLYNMKLFRQSVNSTTSSNDLCSSVNDKSCLMSSDGHDEFVNTCKGKSIVDEILRTSYSSDLMKFPAYIIIAISIVYVAGNVDSKQVEEQRISEILEISEGVDNTRLEKENDAPFINENCKLTFENEIPVCRPLRKSNRLSSKSHGNLIDKSSSANEETSNFKSVVTSDGSLKRRRGRPKVNLTDYPFDESLNSPKRPARRRQAIVDRNVN
ncbi:PREDICTED: E3 ubiquitin-protein ligase RAD18-like [Ceratosolen solmsi marchali]|uniref:RING-type E3 ubiquitin transferase n=1 Tax=Ceratosolen solmsi marchali TaxID=326594 RepID=A0AAJ7DXH4_9HYME|nr:PREDICTED: E3 ubiquitin-protein ligase RAD18-like [Ceratosolen solmsi marchali]